jgi:NAD+ synthase (glutamine-hydrolysing)
MKLFLAQINPTVGAIRQNLALILKAIEEGKRQAADVIVFPQLALSGAPLHDLLFHREIVDECERALQQVAHAATGPTVILGSPATDGRSVYDAAVIFDRGREVGRQHDVCWRWEVDEKVIAVIIGEESGESPGANVDLVVHLAASPWTPRAYQERVHAVTKSVRAHRLPYLFVNLVGGNDGWVFDGNSFLCNADAEVVFRAHSFSEHIGVIDENRSLVSVSDGFHDLHQALLLGIRDYFVKQGMSDAVVALSGGIDSSVTAALAAEALGPSHVHGVMLPSQYTSSESTTGAETVAHSLGIDVRSIPIESVVDPVRLALRQTGIGIEGLTDENLQSRLRSTILMAITNSERSLLLAPGNKSEVALGYTTLYGDLSGALMPLGDLFKTEVYALAHHMNSHNETIASAIIHRPPTAELRPHQKDSDDLPEYEQLDPILRLLIVEGKPIGEVAVQQNVPVELVARLFAKMLSVEFKRRQAPCIVRVSDKCFGNDILYPIVSRHG